MASCTSVIALVVLLPVVTNERHQHAKAHSGTLTCLPSHGVTGAVKKPLSSTGQGMLSFCVRVCVRVCVCVWWRQLSAVWGTGLLAIRSTQLNNQHTHTPNPNVDTNRHSFGGRGTKERVRQLRLLIMSILVDTCCRPRVALRNVIFKCRPSTCAEYFAVRNLIQNAD
jgi:hypothetical protein